MRRSEKREGEVRGRKKETEGERRIAERKRKREEHVENAIDDTARKEGRRGPDMRSQGPRWFFLLWREGGGDKSERGGERRR